MKLTRTKQFRFQYVVFCKNGKILSRRKTLNKLLGADSATIKNSNQKNRRMGQTLHPESTGSKVAVSALACRVHRILSNKVTEYNMHCDIRQSKSWIEVTSRDIGRAVRTASKKP